MTIADLPALNAALNGICFTLLILGRRAILAGEVDRHRKLMLAAFATSTAFLVSYLIYHAYKGVGTRFPEELGWLRLAYLVMLATHVILAIVNLPMIFVTLYLGLKRKDGSHRRWAVPTFWIWSYVSATGVLIYLALYKLAPMLVVSS